MSSLPCTCMVEQEASTHTMFDALISYFYTYFCTCTKINCTMDNNSTVLTLLIRDFYQNGLHLY